MISPESVIIAIFLSELSVVAASVAAASVVAASVAAASVAAASVVVVSAAEGVSVSAELPHPTKDATIAEARTSDNAFFFIKNFPPLNSTHITKTWSNYIDMVS